MKDEGTYQNTEIPNISMHLPSNAQYHFWCPVMIWLDGPDTPVVIFFKSGCYAKVDKLWYTPLTFKWPEVMTGLVYWSPRRIDLESHRVFKLGIHEISKHGWVLE